MYKREKKSKVSYVKTFIWYRKCHNLLYQGKKTKKYKELGPAKLPCCKRVLLYIRPLYNEVPLYCISVEILFYWYSKRAYVIVV